MSSKFPSHTQTSKLVLSRRIVIVFFAHPKNHRPVSVTGDGVWGHGSTATTVGEDRRGEGSPPRSTRREDRKETDEFRGVGRSRRDRVSGGTGEVSDRRRRDLQSQWLVESEGYREVEDDWKVKSGRGEGKGYLRLVIEPSEGLLSDYTVARPEWSPSCT